PNQNPPDDPHDASSRCSEQRTGSCCIYARTLGKIGHQRWWIPSPERDTSPQRDDSGHYWLLHRKNRDSSGAYAASSVGPTPTHSSIRESISPASARMPCPML